MKGRLGLLILLAAMEQATQGQSVLEHYADSIVVPKATNASWWAGIIEDGFEMPLAEGYEADTYGDNHQNQVQPLLLSSQGDVIWSDNPFRIECQQANLLVRAAGCRIVRTNSGNTLREAFLYASSRYFPPSGRMPDERLFSSPQYNTWIELMYDQNQAGILNYAKGIREHGFPGGVLMIDDNWQEDYGKWDFNKGRFPNPRAMIDTLHADGFKVMLWVCPFVSPDCDVCRELAKRGLLVKNDAGEPAIVRWWNGASALLDFTNPEAVSWFRARLDRLQSSYQIDGFKFDAGDSPFYNGVTTSRTASPNEQTELHGRIGLQYPLNEYRAMWKMGGQPLVERLSDKSHSWPDLRKLVPDMLLEGLMGYPFSCPDMIGGGEFTSFLPGSTIDQELIVRSAQCQALMPMMQFSVAPWRVLDETHLKAVLKAVRLREDHTNYILSLARQSALTGEPIVRSLEYVFPHLGYDRVKDQFMLGDSILVAPVLEKGMRNREVVVPVGAWRAFNGKRYRGPVRLSLAVAQDELCYFEKAPQLDSAATTEAQSASLAR